MELEATPQSCALQPSAGPFLAGSGDQEGRPRSVPGSESQGSSGFLCGTTGGSLRLRCAIETGHLMSTGSLGLVSSKPCILTPSNCIWDVSETSSMSLGLPGFMSGALGFSGSRDPGFKVHQLWRFGQELQLLPKPFSGFLVQMTGSPQCWPLSLVATCRRCGWRW